MMGNSAAPGISVFRMLCVVVAAVVVAAVLYWNLVLDGKLGMRPIPTEPIGVTGSVTLNGKPLGEGKIRAKCLDAAGAVTEADLVADGSFELKLRALSHEVRVIASVPGAGDGAAPIDLSSQPIPVLVAESADRNRWAIAISTEEGKLSIATSIAGGPPVLSGAAPRPGRGAVSTEELSRRSVQAYDTDGDGKLHGAELDEAMTFLGSMLKDPDANGDGYVDSAEILDALRRRQAESIAQ
ncbi:MAG: EF-hand domain-containing protein [Planctomycetes bacterium]|nr:EF-hand domain-containing protein [Planctomycetota bacterium]